MTHQPHSWTYIRTKIYLKETQAPARSLQHYSQYPGHGNNQNVYQQMTGLGRCGIYTQWNTIQPKKKNDIIPFIATWVELETLILSEISQKDKDKYHMISLITGI